MKTQFCVSDFVFELISNHEKTYEDIQQEIAKKYHASYKANILPTPDFFVFLKNIKNNPRLTGACFGVTCAKDKSLFSEQYLQTALMKTIAAHIDRPLFRRHIVEVGSVVSLQIHRAGEKLLEMLPWIVWFMGYEAILITATEQVRNIFKKVQINFIPIIDADPHCLITNMNAWGSYYDNKPVTGLIDVKSSLSHKMHEFFTENFSILPKLITAYKPAVKSFSE